MNSRAWLNWRSAYTQTTVFELESIIDRCSSSLKRLRFSAYRPNPTSNLKHGVRDQSEIHNLDLV
jgi:hypothetical protein